MSLLAFAAVLALAATQDAPVATAKKAAPAAVAPKPKLTFQPKTLVDGETLQVILGQRALFRLDDKGQPVLLKVEEGKLAAAHPDGAVTEAFEAPPDGQIAVALDGSAEKRASVLKIWNGTDKPLDYRVIALVLRQQKVTAMPVPPPCAVKPGKTRIETWPAPVVGVGLSRFKTTVTTKACE